MQATRVLRARGRTAPKLAWTLRAVPSPLLASLPELLASAYDGAEVVSTSAAYATAQVSFPKASASTFQKDVPSSGGLTLDGHLVHAAPYAPGRAADSPEDGTRVLVMGLPRGRVVHALRSQLLDAALLTLGIDVAADELTPGPPRKAYDSFARPRDGKPTFTNPPLIYIRAC